MNSAILSYLDSFNLGYKSWSILNCRSYSNIHLASGWLSDELLLAAGTEDGCLAIANFLSGQTISSLADAHIGMISAMCFLRLGKHDVLVSGGNDGILRFWTLGLSELFAIEIASPIYGIFWVDSDRLAVATLRGVITFQINFI